MQLECYAVQLGVLCCAAGSAMLCSWSAMLCSWECYAVQLGVLCCAEECMRRAVIAERSCGSRLCVSQLHVFTSAAQHRATKSTALLQDCSRQALLATSGCRHTKQNMPSRGLMCCSPPLHCRQAEAMHYTAARVSRPRTPEVRAMLLLGMPECNSPGAISKDAKPAHGAFRKNMRLAVPCTFKSVVLDRASLRCCGTLACSSLC